MNPNTSLGPDGFNPGFFQQYWDIVGESITAFCLKCLNNKELPSSLNATNIVLIPKVKCPLKITELRHIALCNVVMKIMSKAIANRMKPLLDVVIYDS